MAEAEGAERHIAGAAVRARSQRDVAVYDDGVVDQDRRHRRLIRSQRRREAGAEDREAPVDRQVFGDEYLASEIRCAQHEAVVDRDRRAIAHGDHRCRVVRTDGHRVEAVDRGQCGPIDRDAGTARSTKEDGRIRIDRFYR